MQTLQSKNEQGVYGLVEEMINNLSNEAVVELSSGYGNDVDRVLDVLFEETQAVLADANRPLDKQAFDIPAFSDSLEETLRSKSMAYFILTCLPEFIMGWHNVEWANLIQLHKNLNVLASRDHSKSYTFSFAYPLWQMWRYRPKGGYTRADGVHVPTPAEIWRAGNGLLVTNEITLARHLLKIIREEVESNPILEERLLPEGKSKNGWGSDSLTAKTGAVLLTKSAGSRARGLHCDYVILDDFLDESSLYSAEQRDKFFNLFSGVFRPILNPGGQMLIVGTPFHEEDLYHTLRKQGVFTCLEYPAIFPDGTLLFPERHSINSLMEKQKTLGSLIFSREILVKPITDNTSIFPYAMLRKAIKGQDEVKLVANIDSSPRKFVKVVVGCDFAISSKIGADYSVFTILGVDEFDKYHVLNSVRMKGASYQQQIAALRRINRDFRPDVMYAEDNGMQEIFIQMMDDANLPVVGKTTNATNKKSLYSGVPSLAVLFETSRIFFPYGDEKAKAMTDMYFAELNSIAFDGDKGKLESTSRHDDTSMSLWQSVRAAKGALADSFDFSFIG